MRIRIKNHNAFRKPSFDVSNLLESYDKFKTPCIHLPNIGSINLKHSVLVSSKTASGGDSRCHGAEQKMKWLWYNLNLQ